MLDAVLKISLIVFMVGSLGAMGLEIPLRDAFAAMRNLRFVALTFLLGFVLCPGIAYLVVRVLSLQEPYAAALLLLGMAPSAPFMPMMVRRANGDLAYGAAFMMLAALGTVIYMPLVAPFLVKGFNAGAWLIARPLILFVLVPLVIGSGVNRLNPRAASSSYPVVRKITNLAAVVMLVALLMIYGKGFIASVGSFATASQVVYIAAVTLLTFWFSAGMEREQRAVLSVGICTRNIGAAFAPLIELKGDPRSTIMVALAVPVTVLLSYATARWLGKRTGAAANAVGSM